MREWGFLEALSGPVIVLSCRRRLPLLAFVEACCVDEFSLLVMFNDQRE